MNYKSSGMLRSVISEEDAIDWALEKLTIDIFCLFQVLLLSVFERVKKLLN